MTEAAVILSDKDKTVSNRSIKYNEYRVKNGQKRGLVSEDETLDILDSFIKEESMKLYKENKEYLNMDVEDIEHEMICSVLEYRKKHISGDFKTPGRRYTSICRLKGRGNNKGLVGISHIFDEYTWCDTIYDSVSLSYIKTLADSYIEVCGYQNKNIYTSYTDEEVKQAMIDSLSLDDESACINFFRCNFIEVMKYIRDIVENKFRDKNGINWDSVDKQYYVMENSEDPEQLPAEINAVNNYTRDEMRKYMDVMLTARENVVISMLYGFTENGECYTLNEVAKHFNVTIERIRQLENKALRKLKNAFTEMTKQEYNGKYLDDIDIANIMLSN